MRPRLESAGVLALVAALSGCAGNELAPLPVRAAGTASASASVSGSATPPSGSASPAASPVRSRSSARVETRAPEITLPPRPADKPTTIIEKPEPEPPESPSSCDDAVLVDLDLQNTELALVPSMCFHVGGVLRMHSIGPGLVTATPESLRDYRYEAAVVTLRFLRPGTVTVTIPQDSQTYTIEVVVVD